MTRPAGDRREEEHAASVHYRWSATDTLPQILSQGAKPDLDDAEHDLAGRPPRRQMPPPGNGQAVAPGG
jgi:hypothetical protein